MKTEEIAGLVGLVVGGAILGFLVGASWMAHRVREQVASFAATVPSAQPAQYDALLVRLIDTEHQLDFVRKQYASFDPLCEGVLCGKLIRECAPKAAP